MRNFSPLYIPYSYAGMKRLQSAGLVLLPHVEHIESLLDLAEGAGVFRMHIEVIRAPIEIFLLFALGISSSMPTCTKTSQDR